MSDLTIPTAADLAQALRLMKEVERQGSLMLNQYFPDEGPTRRELYKEPSSRNACSWPETVSVSQTPAPMKSRFT
jgi:hypothetical protein